MTYDPLRSALAVTSGVDMASDSARAVGAADDALSFKLVENLGEKSSRRPSFGSRRRRPGGMSRISAMTFSPSSGKSWASHFEPPPRRRPTPASTSPTPRGGRLVVDPSVPQTPPSLAGQDYPPAPVLKTLDVRRPEAASRHRRRTTRASRARTSHATGFTTTWRTVRSQRAAGKVGGHPRSQRRRCATARRRGGDVDADVEHAPRGVHRGVRVDARGETQPRGAQGRSRATSRSASKSNSLAAPQPTARALRIDGALPRSRACPSPSAWISRNSRRSSRRSGRGVARGRDGVHRRGVFLRREKLAADDVFGDKFETSPRDGPRSSPARSPGRQAASPRHGAVGRTAAGCSAHKTPHSPTRTASPRKTSWRRKSPWTRLLAGGGRVRARGRSRTAGPRRRRRERGDRRRGLRRGRGGAGAVNVEWRTRSGRAGWTNVWLGGGGDARRAASSTLRRLPSTPGRTTGRRPDNHAQQGCSLGLVSAAGAEHATAQGAGRGRRGDGGFRGAIVDAFADGAAAGWGETYAGIARS